MNKKIRKAILSVSLASMLLFSSCDFVGELFPSTNQSSEQITVTNILLSDTYVEMLAGDNYAITATAYNEEQVEKNAKLTWTSSDPTIAVVNNGKIIALAGGNATLSVTCGEITKSMDVFVAKRITSKQVNTFDEKYVNIYGRSYVVGDKLNLDHSANAVELAFIGASLSVDITSTTDSYMRVYVDKDTEGKRLQVQQGEQTYTVAENLTNGYHKIRIVKATESLHASWDVSGFWANAFATLPEKSDLKIEFIGDSITAGNANLGSDGDAWSVDNSDSAKTYAYFTAQNLNADYSIVALSGICVKAYHWVKNLNMSTMYANISNVNTQAYEFDFEPDIVVLNLGTNDANYLGKPEGVNYGSQFPNDYYEFLSFIRAKNPNAYIICLYGMMGANYTVSTGIQTAIAQMNDGKIVYNPFEFVANTSGGAYHPSLSAQKTWGEDLATYIQGLNF